MIVEDQERCNSQKVCNDVLEFPCDCDSCGWIGTTLQLLDGDYPTTHICPQCKGIDISVKYHHE